MQETPTPFLATGGDGSPRISPTDVSQFIRLEQCERYLRLRLHEHNVDGRFMPAYGVVPQRIPPLLTRSGRQFEEEVEQQIAAAYDSLRFSAGTLRGGQRPPDNERVTQLARDLKPGDVFVLLQPRLEAVVGG